ncbi:MAG TPA: threonine--tRNA ligase, partial [Candidatus Erysipelatoclostridium merdavium]|nr:threonine--tRNA ligase [Candidatus Erysipelatoclostridium merdavium]
DDKEKYFDDDQMWDEAEAKLREVLTELNLDYFEAKGEAAFYGPKLDVEVKPAVGPEVTLSTCQLDFLLPRRFELTYVDNNGIKQTPVVLHRAIFGTFDRFTAFLIEETKGVFPLWLSPVQVKVLPVNNEYHLEYAKEVESLLKQQGFRVELDAREEKLGYRIREGQMEKVPYLLVLGNNERDEKTVTYREHGQQKQTTVPFDEFTKMMKEKIENRQ